MVCLRPLELRHGIRCTYDACSVRWISDEWRVDFPSAKLGERSMSIQCEASELVDLMVQIVAQLKADPSLSIEALADREIIVSAGVTRE